MQLSPSTRTERQCTKYLLPYVYGELGAQIIGTQIWIVSTGR